MLLLGEIDTMKFLVGLAVFCTIVPALFASEQHNVLNLSTEDLSEWESKEFAGVTQYDVVQLNGESVLKAFSQNAASGLVKEERIDLKKTPYLNWRWRTDNFLPGMDEKSKAGDDYVARVYVVVSGGAFFWRTHALNYVWSSNQAKGAFWPNAYAKDNAKMLALRAKEDGSSVWYTEKRNVLEDMKKYFGEDIQYIDAVAIMTDTDNGHGKATSYYGDIYFTAE